jgi:hypothetical protein
MKLHGLMVQLLALRATQGSVHLVFIVFIADIVVLLLLVLLSRCTMGFPALRHHKLDLKRILLLTYMFR